VAAASARSARGQRVSAVTTTLDYRAHLRRRLLESNVPGTLHTGLVEYFAARRPTGGFLRAVLENDLGQAAMRGDEINRWHVADIALFLFNYCPAPAWGSPAKVDAWLADPSPVPEIIE
jgi:hypothetical protein